MRFSRLLALAVLIVGGVAVADDWPGWRGPRRDGVSHEKGWRDTWPRSGPPVLWRAKVGEGYAAASVVGERVYAMGNERGHDVVWCLDAATGRPVWRFRYKCRGGGVGWPGARIAPEVSDGRVYTLGLKGHIHCLDARSGKLLWSRDTARGLRAKGGKHGFSCHPLVDGDRLIVELGARGGSVVAFDKKNGKVLWQSGDMRAGHASPVIGNVGGVRTLLVFTAEGLVGMEPSNGRELWRFPCSIRYGCNIATPVVSDGLVFISTVYWSGGSALLRVKGRKPRPVWTGGAMRNHCTGSVLWKGHLYGFSGRVSTRRGRGQLRCVDWRDGKLLWSKSGYGTGGVIVADGKLIIQGDRGELAVADAKPGGFRLISRAKVLDGRCWNAPVLANGRIYCRSFEGELVCVDVREKRDP